MATGCVAACVAACLVGCGSSPGFHGKLVEPPRDAPEIVAVNWDGKTFRLSDQRGKVVVLFFGYTSCPDVCPMTLSRLKGVYRDLAERAEDVAVVFVSVDPERDAEDRLAQYVPAFDRRFYGVRLEGRDLARAIADYGLKVQRHRPDEPGGYYAVDHTGTLFVVDAEGLLRLEFPHDAPAERILPDLETLLGSTADG